MYISAEKEEIAIENSATFQIEGAELKEMLNYISYTDRRINNTLNRCNHIAAEEQEDAKSRIVKLTSGIRKLPRFNNSTLYRCEIRSATINNIFRRLSNAELINWYAGKVGMLIRYPSYLSTRHSIPPAGNYIVIEIRTSIQSSGRNLFEIFDEEDEVLFEAESQFRVIEVNTETLEIVLEEIIEGELDGNEDVHEMDCNFLR